MCVPNVISINQAELAISREFSESNRVGTYIFFFKHFKFIWTFFLFLNIFLDLLELLKGWVSPLFAFSFFVAAFVPLLAQRDNFSFEFAVHYHWICSLSFSLCVFVIRFERYRLIPSLILKFLLLFCLQFRFNKCTSLQERKSSPVFFPFSPLFATSRNLFFFFFLEGERIVGKKSQLQLSKKEWICFVFAQLLQRNKNCSPIKLHFWTFLSHICSPATLSRTNEREQWDNWKVDRCAP